MNLKIAIQKSGRLHEGSMQMLKECGIELSNGNNQLQKFGEEAVELIIESKEENKERFLNEAADLLYHYLVLLQARNFKLNDVLKVLAQRQR